MSYNAAHIIMNFLCQPPDDLLVGKPAVANHAIFRIDLFNQFVETITEVDKAIGFCFYVHLKSSIGEGSIVDLDRKSIPHWFESVQFIIGYTIPINPIQDADRRLTKGP